MKIFEDSHLLSCVPVLCFPNTPSPISTYEDIQRGRCCISHSKKNDKVACSSFRGTKIIKKGQFVCLSMGFWNKYCVQPGTFCMCISWKACAFLIFYRKTEDVKIGKTNAPIHPKTLLVSRVCRSIVVFIICFSIEN